MTLIRNSLVGLSSAFCVGVGAASGPQLGFGIFCICIIAGRLICSLVSQPLLSHLNLDVNECILRLPGLDLQFGFEQQNDSTHPPALPFPPSSPSLSTFCFFCFTYFIENRGLAGSVFFSP
jgi:hypothetical protein